MKKRIASLFTSLLMIVSLMVVMPTMSVSATQSKINNFNKLYTLTGNAQNDMVAIAKAQIGMTQSQLGYTEQWCADFVSDCARLANQSIAIPANGSCYSLMNAVKNAGGHTVSKSEALPGDLVFFSSSSNPNGGAHVELVYGYSNGVLKSIGGNCHIDGVSKVYDRSNGKSSSVSYYCVIRPNYTSLLPGKPTNVKLSKNQYWYDLKDTITLTPSSNGATSYVMSVEKDGKRIIDCISLNGAYSFAANKWGYGKYHAWISATNNAGTTDSSACDFEVVKAPSYSDVWCSKGFYDYDSNESIDIYIKASCTKGQTIGIDYLDEDLNPVKRVVTSNCGNSYKISTKSLGKGYFSAYFTIWNGSGSVDTKRTYFYVGQKQNVGTDFYARIKNNAANKYLTNSNGNVNGTTLNCSKQQIWKFVRQSDNSYKLISAYDNGAMDVKDYATSGSGTNVQMNSSWDTNAQKFYIYYINKSYYFKPVCADLALDLSNKTSNLEVWGAGFNWNPQKFSIEKVNTNDIGVHKFSTWTTTKNATCTQVGTKSRKCTVCGKTETQTIAKTGHKSVTDKAIPATCTTDGKTEGSHCSVCGAVIKAQEIIKATGHKFGNWTTIKPATCTESGTQIRKCETCGATESKSLSAKGHTEVVDKAIPATCTTDGKTEGSHCSVCGAVIKAQEIIKATGHKFGNWTTIKPATCTESGTQIRKCETCGATESKSLSAKGHTEVVDKAIPATCTTDGKTEGSHCSVCGAVIKAQEIIKATGHKFGNWTTIKPATCTESGTQIRKCETCGATESKSLSAKGHTEVVDKAIPATCTTDGKTEGSHCSVCGAVIKAQTTITATGHKSSGWIVDKTASIGVKGSKHKECTVCKKVLETAEIPALSRISISKASVTLSTSTYAYDGKAKKPGVTVKLNGKTLKNGTDYTVSYSNNTKVGTAKVTITGKGNYTGSVSKTYSIKNNFKKATVSGISNKSYTGKNITQSITVKYNGKTLKKGTDYTVSYSSNKNIGTATVKIAGKGSYTGTITKTFKINPAKQEIQKLTAKSKAFFVDWAQKGSATGYEIQYATNSKFTSAKKVTITNNKTDKTTVSKLSGKKKYYVRVRSYTTVKGTKYYGAWSSTKTVTTRK